MLAPSKAEGAAVRKFVQQREELEARRRMAAKDAQHSREDSFFQQFGQAVRGNRINPAPLNVTQETLKELADRLKYVNNRPQPVVLQPREVTWHTSYGHRTASVQSINVKRNWGRLLREHPRGIYEFAQEATGRLTFAGSRTDLKAAPGIVHPGYEFSDATGTHRADVMHLSLPDALMTGSDRRLGAKLDEHIGRIVTQQAIKLAGKARPTSQHSSEPVAALLQTVLDEHALYPAIHISAKPHRSVAKNGEVAYVFAVAVAWMYAPGLDEEDDDD
jgi:hypothetical protein